MFFFFWRLKAFPRILIMVCIVFPCLLYLWVNHSCSSVLFFILFCRAVKSTDIVGAWYLGRTFSFFISVRADGVDVFFTFLCFLFASDVNFIWYSCIQGIKRRVFLFSIRIFSLFFKTFPEQTGTLLRASSSLILVPGMNSCRNQRINKWLPLEAL